MNGHASARSTDSPKVSRKRFPLFWALQDETSRMILAHTTEHARSANDLASFSDVSLDTIYRRLQTLNAHGLVQEKQRIDEQGNRYNVYQATISRVEVEVTDETIQTHVDEREDAAKRFTNIWEAIQR